MDTTTSAQPCWLCARGCRPPSCTQHKLAGEGRQRQAAALHVPCLALTCSSAAQATCKAHASCASDQMHAPLPLLRSLRTGAPVQAGCGQQRSMRRAPCGPSCFRCRPPAVRTLLAQMCTCTSDRPTCALCAQVHQAVAVGLSSAYVKGGWLAACTRCGSMHKVVCFVCTRCCTVPCSALCSPAL